MPDHEDVKNEVQKEVRLAVLEVNVKNVQENVNCFRAEAKQDNTDLHNAMKQGFTDVNATLKELKERDNVSEFFQKNWKVVALVIAMVTGGNSWEIVKALLSASGG